MQYDDSLIEKIIESVDIVEEISKYVKLTKKGKEYFGMCPFHKEEDASFSVTPNNKKWYCFGCNFGGNVITFISKIKKMKFDKVIELLMNSGNIEYKEYLQSPTIKIFKSVNKQTKKDKKINRTPLNSNSMNNFPKESVKEWINEGISEDVLNLHNVRYDKKNNRIVFPIYDNNGKLINIKGRTLFNDYKQLGIDKYIYYYSLGTIDFLYSLHNKKEIIKDCNELIVFESEKSVMKMDTFNILNSSAICTSHINQEQLKLLLGLRCNIVIALDKGIDLDKIKHNIKLLARFTNTFVVYDKNNLLREKDSPVDCGLDVWNKLYKSKIRV